MNFSQYTVKTPESVLTDFKSSLQGLSGEEAEKQQKIFGFNEIKTQKIRFFPILVRQLKSSFFYLLFLAALAAFFIGENINALLILLFVFINVCLGFFQEFRAEKASALLQKYIPLKSRILRDGKEKIIEKEFLVPGDIVLLEAGNIIPADLRIIKAQNFLVNEEILTGESAPAVKISETLSQEAGEIFEAKNILFAGASIVSGEAQGIVIGTGKNTLFGEIAKLTTQTAKESAYGKNLLHFSRLILRIVVVTILAVFFLKLIITGTTNFFDFLIFCITLVVSIIPEALPLVATFSLSRGALKLAKEKVVVKRLAAIEDLGNMEILCTDKTGTLTENKLTLYDIYSPDKEKCLLYGLLSSSYIHEEIESVANPFDIALWDKTPPKLRNLLSIFRAISEIPFDSFRLKNSVLVEDKEGKKILIVKGAPETILALSSETESGEKFTPLETSFLTGFDQTKTRISQAGKEGKRILGIAYKEFKNSHYSATDEKDLTFLGYFVFTDPLKKTAISAIELAKKLGVRIKILTGDSPEVAGAIAKEIGLLENLQEVVLGKDLESYDQLEFERACNQFQVFARVSPQTKFKIVEILQKKFEVGFLGEGINDAPALKNANVAIAVREGADISREVSDIILLKKDLRVIMTGIQEGRKIFANINKYIKCTISSNFGNFYSIAAISLFIPFLPMLPVQILLVNLLSDFPLIAIATDKVDVKELKKPKLYQLKYFVSLIVLLALVSTVFDFIFFAIFYQKGPELLRTLWFIESILTEVLLIFSVRTTSPFWKTKLPSFPLLLLSFLAIGVTLVLPFTSLGKEFFLFTAPPLTSLLIVMGLLFGYFMVSEIVKLVYFQRKSGKIA